MTDAHENTPSKENDHSTTLEPDFDDYGLNQQEDGTRIIRIDHERHFFRRVGTVECHPTGVVLREHTRLTDGGTGDTAEVYQATQFVSARSAEFERRLRDAVFDLVYGGKVPQEKADGLSAELAEAMANQYNDGSSHQ